MLSKLVIRLALTLLALWFLLSGMFKTQLIILGFLSIALVTTT
jgi:heme/copper-type cytochrome/quinol oxidase subunit 4